MGDHHFISYSSFDGWDFAVKLCDELEAGPPPIAAWLDQREIMPGQDWDTQVVEAISTCKSLIFVMTHDSVEDESECKNEWTRALKYKKPILPLRVHRDAEMPFRLGSRNYIDFTGGFDTALARLRKHLQWLGSQEGELQTLKYRLQDAQRDLRRADPSQRVRIQDEISALRQQIADQGDALQNPQEAKARAEESIARGVEREREPEKPVGGATHTKFINPPPIIAPSYFQDRHVETGLIGDFLKDEALRLMTVVGRGGTGKTAMVCRLLKSLEGGSLPDDGRPLRVDGIVYLSETGSRGVGVPYLYADLCQLLPDDVAEGLDKLYKNPQASIEAKMYALLEAFPSGRYVLLLDNFESVIDLETREIKDAELKEALRVLLEHPRHAIKVLVTTRLPLPENLATVRPEKQRRIDLDEGLDSPYAENILREMDADGKVGLKAASDELLDKARQRTRGFPRALEALFAILSADRDTTLPDILEDTQSLLPENVVEVLVGEAFSRLDPVAQLVMQALAIYAYPATPAAVDYLLLPYRTGGVDSAPVLNRLVNMQFARREAGRRYYLHQVDRAYALSRVPKGEETDRDEMEAPPFTQFALLDRAADYLAQTRTPRESWKTIEDLAPQLQEFELRYEGQDYDTAVSVLMEIDLQYLYRWGHYGRMTDLHERLQGKLSDPYLKKESQYSLGSAYSGMGRIQEAKTCFEQALDIDREIGDRASECAGLLNIGDCYHSLGRIDYAIGHFERALDIAREISDRASEGSALAGLGYSYNTWGQKERAIDYLDQALDIAHEIGDREGEGSRLITMGSVYHAMGQYPEAKVFTEEALDIVRELGDRGSESQCLVNLGAIYSSLGQTERAIDYLNQALDVAHEIGDRYNETYCLLNLGTIHDRLGQTTRAMDSYKQALDIAREVGDRATEGLLLSNLGAVYSELGQTTRAMDSYKQALDIAREVGDRWLEGLVLSNLGAVYSELGQTERAIDYLDQALDVARAAGHQWVETISLANLGDEFIRQAEWRKAEQLYKRANRTADEMEARVEQRKTWIGLARTSLYAGDLPSARTAINAARRYEPPVYNYDLLALAGVIALRTGDLAAAQEVFEVAVAQAEAQLNQGQQRYSALDVKGLSLCGLALCEGNHARIPAAMEAYRKAREITKDAGIVADVLRLFDALMPADSEGMLAEVRAVAAGTEVSSI